MHDDARVQPGSDRAGSAWIDRRVLDRSGELLGVVVDVYDDASRRPTWLAISTGFFGARVTVAPLDGARLLGEDVVIAHDAATVRTAPAVTTVVTIHPAGVRRLVAHYCRPGAPVPQPESSPVT